MGNNATSSLDILIRTIADASGVTLTTEQMEKLRDVLGEAKEGSKKIV